MGEQRRARFHPLNSQRYQLGRRTMRPAAKAGMVVACIAVVGLFAKVIGGGW